MLKLDMFGTVIAERRYTLIEAGKKEVVRRIGAPSDFPVKPTIITRSRSPVRGPRRSVTPLV
jgi:hypothetical protein